MGSRRRDERGAVASSGPAKGRLRGLGGDGSESAGGWKENMES